MKGLFFTYLMTYGGAAVAVFNPFYGLLIYICFAIIKPSSLWYWSVPPGHYSRIIAIAMLIGWAFKGFGNWNFRGAKPIVLALLGYWSWMVLSAIFAPDQATAWRFVEGQTKIVLPFVVGITLIDSVQKLKQLAWVLMLSQAYGAFELNLSYYSGFNRLVEVGLWGDNNCTSIGMVTGAGLAFFLGLHEHVWWRKWLAFAAAALMAHVPMFGMSRGGMLALIVTGIVGFFLIPKKPKHYLAFGLAVVIGLRLAGPSVMEEFSTVFVDAEQRDSSAQVRLDMWRMCWELMLKHPSLGIGTDQFQSVAAEAGYLAGTGTGGFVGRQAHSLWFQTGAELGFPGVGFLMAFYGLAAWHLWRLSREKNLTEAWFADSARMVIAALAGFVVAVSFVSMSGLEIPYYVVLLGASALKLVGDYRPTFDTAAVEPAIPEASMQFAGHSATHESFRIHPIPSA